MTQLTREEAKRRIVAMMIDGGLDPDTAISERSLSERTGLGRTPIREALQDLARDGPIVIEPKRGSFVRRLGLDDVREIFEVRYALEALAASLAAMRGPSARLREIHDELTALQGRDLAAQEARHAKAVGHELHNEIVKCTRNGLLVRQYSQVRLMIEISLSLTEHREAARLKATIDEHLDICGAVLAGDPAAAQAEMQRHLRTGHELRMRILNDFPALTLTVPKTDDLDRQPGPSQQGDFR